MGEVDGFRALRPETTSTLGQVRASGTDQVLGLPTSYSAGFMAGAYLGDFYVGRSLSDKAFGHAGSGGSMAFADPDNGLALGYNLNGLAHYINGDPRIYSIVAALYGCL